MPVALAGPEVVADAQRERAAENRATADRLARTRDPWRLSPVDLAREIRTTLHSIPATRTVAFGKRGEYTPEGDALSQMIAERVYANRERATDTRPLAPAERGDARSVLDWLSAAQVWASVESARLARERLSERTGGLLARRSLAGDGILRGSVGRTSLRWVALELFRYSREWRDSAASYRTAGEREAGAESMIRPLTDDALEREEVSKGHAPIVAPESAAEVADALAESEWQGVAQRQAKVALALALGWKASAQAERTGRSVRAIQGDVARGKVLVRERFPHALDLLAAFRAHAARLDGLERDPDYREPSPAESDALLAVSDAQVSERSYLARRLQGGGIDSHAPRGSAAQVLRYIARLESIRAGVPVPDTLRGPSIERDGNHARTGRPAFTPALDASLLIPLAQRVLLATGSLKASKRAAQAERDAAAWDAVSG